MNEKIIEAIAKCTHYIGESCSHLKYWYLAVAGAAAFASWLGLTSELMTAVVVFFALDFLTGILAAFKMGRFRSGMVGLGQSMLKAVGYWAFLIVARYAGLLIPNSTDFIWAEALTVNAAATLILVNEGASIIENCINLGIKLPKKLIEGFKAYQDRMHS